MSWLEKVGSGYTDRIHDIAVTAGDVVYTRLELAKVAGNCNFIAAEALSMALAQLKPPSLDYIYRHIDQFDLRAFEGVGTTAVFVLCRILDANGYNVDWWLDQDHTERRKRQKRSRRGRRRM